MSEMDDEWEPMISDEEKARIMSSYRTACKATTLCQSHFGEYEIIMTCNRPAGHKGEHSQETSDGKLAWGVQE